MVEGVGKVKNVLGNLSVQFLNFKDRFVIFTNRPARFRNRLSMQARVVKPAFVVSGFVVYGHSL